MEAKGDFITVEPQNPIVARHISYYYFHVSDDKEYSNKFSFYPNYKHALTIYKGSDVKLIDGSSIVRPSEDDACSVFYTINSSKDFKVDFKGAFNKIGIVFNPLGINHFIEVSLDEVFDKSIGEFNYFGTDLHSAAIKIYSEPDPLKKGELLDTFFISRYVGFEDAVVKKAIAEIFNSNGTIKVEELSDLADVNRKTLLRLFKKHLRCSVEEYKKMVMFRNALNYSQQANDTSLTDVALYNLYYDQAHFIKHFKSVTHQSPKVLLSKLTKLGNQETYWNFEE